MDVIQEIERQLLMVLLENIPEPAARPKRENESLLNGPQLDTSKAGVVASQIRWTICWTVLFYQNTTSLRWCFLWFKFEF